MGLIRFSVKGDWSKTTRFLKRASENSKKIESLEFLNKYGEAGVAALMSATPVRTGLTASSWSYEVRQGAEGTISINFINTNYNKGVNVALLIEYGHGTRNGGFVQGIDYINPAIQPVFEQMANELWKEVCGP